MSALTAFVQKKFILWNVKFVTFYLSLIGAEYTMFTKSDGQTVISHYRVHSLLKIKFSKKFISYKFFSPLRIVFNPTITSS